ncbi:MAG: metal-sensitive transcriptional regulator, partial [Phycicoccus sp.]
MTTPVSPAPQGSAAHHEHGYVHYAHREDYLKRLRRIEGQARGLQRMVEEEKYCID